MGKFGRGGFGGLGDIAKLMKEAQKMQDNMETAREELQSARVEATSGGGAVKAIVDGEGKLVSITLSKDAVDPDDVEMLQDLIMTAIKDAESKAEDLQRERMQSVTGGMNLPGLF